MASSDGNEAAAEPLDSPAAEQPRRVAHRECEVCGIAPAKYSCPGCERKTCSLACVKAHKEEAQCSGKRDRTAFLGRGKLDERSLLSDYRFLEEVKLAEDVAKRSKPPAPRAELPSYLQSLVYQARRRGVQLHILPPGMERRRCNTTRYDGRQQLLSWRVEWGFPAAGCRTSSARIEEHMRLVEVLGRHLTPRPGQSMRTPELREYADAGLGRLTVALRKERMPANAPVYYRIDVGQPLRHQLEGKVVVEFPSFLVLLPREVGEYSFVEQPAARVEQQREEGQQGEPT